MMTWDFFFRLLVAGVLGALVGIDREYRAKEAGFRTHFLVALGSALFMIVSKYGFEDILGKEGVGLDPSRIASQVVTGIGFLGAGTIIIQKLFVRGLTTAAGIWTTAAVGLAVGAGQYWLGISATLLTLLGLEGLGYMFRNFSQRNVNLTFTVSGVEALQLVMDEIKNKRHLIVSFSTEIVECGEKKNLRVALVVGTRTGKVSGSRSFVSYRVWSEVSAASVVNPLRCNPLQIHRKRLRCCRFWLP